jgi:hypothetical protein
MSTPQKQNEIKDVVVKKLSAQNLENLFYIFQRDNGQYFYNITRTVNFPEDLDPNLFEQYETKPKDTWPLIAYSFYQDVRLWWLVCLVNQIINPVKQPEAGTVIKILNADSVRSVLNKIKEG